MKIKLNELRQLVKNELKLQLIESNSDSLPMGDPSKLSDTLPHPPPEHDTLPLNVGDSSGSGEQKKLNKLKDKIYQETLDAEQVIYSKWEPKIKKMYMGKTVQFTSDRGKHEVMTGVIEEVSIGSDYGQGVHIGLSARVPGRRGGRIHHNIILR